MLCRTDAVSDGCCGDMRCGGMRNGGMRVLLMLDHGLLWEEETSHYFAESGAIANVQVSTKLSSKMLLLEEARS